MANDTPSMAATQNTTTCVRRLSFDVSFHTSILLAKKFGTVRIAAATTDASGVVAVEHGSQHLDEHLADGDEHHRHAHVAQLLAADVGSDVIAQTRR